MASPCAAGADLLIAYRKFAMVFGRHAADAFFVDLCFAGVNSRVR